MNLDKSNERGRGGYGSVYLANNLRTYGSKAAIKILTKVSCIYRFCIIGSHKMKVPRYGI